MHAPRGILLSGLVAVLVGVLVLGGSATSTQPVGDVAPNGDVVDIGIEHVDCFPPERGSLLDAWPLLLSTALFSGVYYFLRRSRRRPVPAMARVFRRQAHFGGPEAAGARQTCSRSDGRVRRPANVSP